MDRWWTPWLGWLGWTLVFALLFSGVLAPLFLDVRPDLSGHVSLMFFVLTLLAAFAIGVRFPSSKGPFGPPVAIIASVAAIVLLLDSSPGKPGPMGNMSDQTAFVFLLVWGGWAILAILALLYALLAWAGVKVGQRREHDVAGRDVDASDQASRLTQG